MRMKPKSDSFVGTGQRISQGDTMLRGNEGVKHRLKTVEQVTHHSSLVKGRIWPHNYFLNHRLIKSLQFNTWLWLRSFDISVSALFDSLTNKIMNKIKLRKIS